MRGTTAVFALGDSGALNNPDHLIDKGDKLPSILPNLFLRKSLNRSGSDCRTNDPGRAARDLELICSISGAMMQQEIHHLRLPVNEASCLRLAENTVETPMTLRRAKRFRTLQNQLQQANRRAAGPFSHPFATRGSLSKLREQIRDVSRVADAVLLNAESAGEHRIEELCRDLKSLLQTQQRWTDRLENQIWRLESQVSLMKRLQRLLRDRSPCSDHLWELCELIARETQALPTGLLLLPEPGHRILFANDEVSSRVSWSLEQARLAVFSALTLLPDVCGADIVAQTLQASSSALAEFAERDYASSVFAEPRWMQRRAIARPTAEVSRLIDLAGLVLTKTEELSLTAADTIAPPAIETFYAGLLSALETDSGSEANTVIALDICRALSPEVTDSPSSSTDRAAADDASIVLTHKLRWHDGTPIDSAQCAPAEHSRAKRPHLSALHPPPLKVFAMEQ